MFLANIVDFGLVCFKYSNLPPALHFHHFSLTIIPSTLEPDGKRRIFFVLFDKGSKSDRIGFTNIKEN